VLRIKGRFHTADDDARVTVVPWKPPLTMSPQMAASGRHESDMTIEEQRMALYNAGFVKVEQLLCKGGLVLHRAV
jgi:hypothetical protein